VRIRILTSCTKKKAVSCANPITAEDFERGEEHLNHREDELFDHQLPAGEMYTGLQHRYLMEGVRAVRNSKVRLDIDVAIISAGYGVVSEEDLIAPYERAFNGKTKTEIRELSNRLDIPEESRRFLAEPADLTLVLLGGKYLHAVDFDESVVFGGDTLLFCSQSAMKSLPDWEEVKKVAVTQKTARRFSEALVRLKGILAKRLLLKIARDPTAEGSLMQPQTDVVNALDNKDLQAKLEL
jgi:hypothetical protein